MFNEVLFSLLVFFGVSFFCLRYPDKVFAKILFLGFVVRAGLAYLQRFVVLLPGSTADATTFERNAWRAAEAWRSGAEATVKLTGSGYYTRLIAWFYSFFGRTPLIAQFINVLLGTLVIFIVYKTVLVLFEKKGAARIAALITAFFPTLCLFSAIILRETVVVFFLALSLYFFACWLKGKGLRFILFSLIAVFISSIYHGGVIFVGGAYLLVFSFYRIKKRKWAFSRQFILGVILGIIYFSLFYGYFGSKTLCLSKVRRSISVAETTALEQDKDLIEEDDAVLEALSRHTSIASRGRTAYLDGLVPRSSFDLIWQTPIRAAYLFSFPSPKNIESVLDVAGLLDAFLYLFLFIFFFNSLWLLRKKSKVILAAFFLILITFCGPFAWGTSNYGTAIRHRQKIVFLLIIGASYSLGKRRGEKLDGKGFSCWK